MALKKAFFRQATKAERLNKPERTVFSSGIIANILLLQPDECGYLEYALIPERFRDARHFDKHGKDVKLKRIGSLEEALLERKTIKDLFAEKAKKLDAKPKSYYSIKPFGADTRTVRIPLVEVVEGLRLWHYADGLREGAPRIDIPLNYMAAPGAAEDGAVFEALVPSMRKGLPRYRIKFSNVPVAEHKSKWKLSYDLFTDHVCGRKRYYIRFAGLGSRDSSFQHIRCRHEVAGYLQYCENMLNMQGNHIPYEQSQFIQPTQLMLGFYEKLENSLLIAERGGSNPRKPLMKEKEILLWGLVKKHPETSTTKYMKNLNRYYYKAAERHRH